MNVLSQWKDFIYLLLSYTDKPTYDNVFLIWNEPGDILEHQESEQSSVWPHPLKAQTVSF